MQHLEVEVNCKVKVRVAIENDDVELDTIKEDVEGTIADTLQDYVNDFSHTDALDAEVDDESIAVSFGTEGVEYSQTDVSSEEVGEVVTA